MAKPTGLSGMTVGSNKPALGPTTWDGVVEQLEIIAPLLSEVEEASRADAFNWNLDYSQGFSLLLPHLMHCKEAVQWLTVATQVALREGRLDDATVLIETQLRLVHNMEQGGLLINELVRIAMAAITWTEMWGVLQAEGFTDEQLERLDAAWSTFRPVEGMIQALRLERAVALLEYQRCRDSASYMANTFGTVGMGFGVGAAAGPPDNFIEAAIEWLEENVFSGDSVVACRWWGWFDSYEDEQFYIQAIQSVIDDAERRLAYAGEQEVPAKGLAPGEPWLPPVDREEEGPPKRFLFAGPALPSLQMAMHRAFFVRMQQEMVRTTIALKRHQLRHGRLPEQLADLVPGLLASVPVDWMDGQLLRYRAQTDDDFLLYSVNKDESDDGGDARPANPQSWALYLSNGQDFVWPQETLPPLKIARDFEFGFRLSATNTEPETIRVQLRSNEPPAWITVVPQALDQPTDSGGHSIVGTIEVSTGSPPTLCQTLLVWGADRAQIKSMFEVLDLNFDGYPDLLTLYEAGAKAGRRSLWLYEPSAGRYSTNSVTAEFQNISHHTLTLDHEQQLIRMTHFAGICTNAWETWRIQGGRLLSVEAMVHVPEDDKSCHVTHLKRTGDEMQVVEEQRVRCLEPDLVEPYATNP
jgi:hypothetical protein